MDIRNINLTTEEDDQSINQMIDRILAQKKFIYDLSSKKPNPSIYNILMSGILTKYTESLNNLLADEKIAKEYTDAIEDLFIFNNRSRLTNYFKKHLSIYSFFVNNFYIIEHTNQNHNSRLLTQSYINIEQYVIYHLNSSRTKDNTHLIQNIIDIIHGKTNELSEEAKLLLNTPEITYAFSFINDYEKSIPYAIKANISNTKNTFRLHLNKIQKSYYAIHGKFPSLLPDFEFGKLQLRTTIINYLETSIQNGKCTTEEAKNHLATWDNIKHNENNINVLVDKFIQANPASLFGRLEFRTTIAFSRQEPEDLLVSLVNATEAEKVIALKEINRRLLSDDCDGLFQALKNNENATTIIKDNLTAIAKKLYAETKKYYINKHTEYLANYAENRSAGKSKVADKEKNDAPIYIIYTPDGGPSYYTETFPELEENVEGYDAHNKLVAKLNTATEIIRALKPHAHQLDDTVIGFHDSDNNDFNALKNLCDCLQAATSLPGIETLSNPRHPDMDKLVSIMKEAAIVIGIVILTPLIIPVPFLILALVAHNLFPKKPDGNKVVETKDEARLQLGLN